jgi:ribose 5-phosphate isomerase B
MTSESKEKPMRIGLVADHAGFVLREPVAVELQSLGCTVIDFGATTFESDDDSPELVAPLAEALAMAEIDRGVAISGFGIGACIAANKISGVRASVCHEICSARVGVEQDDMNLLVVGARVTGADLCLEIVRAFVKARSVASERQRRRRKSLEELESKYRAVPRHRESQ